MDFPPRHAHGYTDSSYSNDHDHNNPFDSSLPLRYLDVPTFGDAFDQESSSAVPSGNFTEDVPFCENCAALAPLLCTLCSQMLMDIDSVTPRAADTTSLAESVIQHEHQTSFESANHQDPEAHNVSHSIEQVYSAALPNDHLGVPPYYWQPSLNDRFDLDRWPDHLLLDNMLGLEFPQLELRGLLSNSDDEWFRQESGPDYLHPQPGAADDVPPFQEVLLDMPLNYGPGRVHRRRHFNAAERREIAAKRGRVCDDCRRRKRKVSG